MAAYFKLVIDANYRLVVPPSTRRSAIGRSPRVASYDMLGEQLHYSNPLKYRQCLLFESITALKKPLPLMTLLWKVCRKKFCFATIFSLLPVFMNCMSGICVLTTNGGYYNEAEACQVVTICSQILQAYPDHLQQSDIAVVTSYRDQVSN